MPNYPQTKLLGRYLAISRKPDGTYVRTYHDFERLAHRRLNGVRRHDGKVVIDTQPPKKA